MPTDFLALADEVFAQYGRRCHCTGACGTHPSSGDLCGADTDLGAVPADLPASTTAPLPEHADQMRPWCGPCRRAYRERQEARIVAISHGGDFFGQDQIPARRLRELGQYVRGVLPSADHPPLTQLLDTAGETDVTIGAGQAALLAVLLRRAGAHRGLKRTHSALAARLGNAAALAAADTAPWTWTTADGPRR